MRQARRRQVGRGGHVPRARGSRRHRRDPRGPTGRDPRFFPRWRNRTRAQHVRRAKSTPRRATGRGRGRRVDARGTCIAHIATVIVSSTLPARQLCQPPKAAPHATLQPRVNLDDDGSHRSFQAIRISSISFRKSLPNYQYLAHHPDFFQLPVKHARRRPRAYARLPRDRGV